MNLRYNKERKKTATIITSTHPHVIDSSEEVSSTSHLTKKSEKTKNRKNEN